MNEHNDGEVPDQKRIQLGRAEGHSEARSADSEKQPTRTGGSRLLPRCVYSPDVVADVARCTRPAAEPLSEMLLQNGAFENNDPGGREERNRPS
ncbi:hypothetical protein AGIG_G5173 [Arapaima gigas]